MAKNAKEKAAAKAKKKKPAKPKAAKKIDIVKTANQRRHLALLEKFKSKVDLSKSELAELSTYENQTSSNPVPEVQGQVFDTQKEAANYAGVSTRTIRNWIAEGLPMVGKKYVAVFLDAWKKNDGSQADEIKDRKNTGEAENKELKNVILRMQIANLKGDVIPTQEVEDGRIERILLVKTVLLGLARKLPPLLKDKTTREMTAVIKEEVEHCINIFSGKEK